MGCAIEGVCNMRRTWAALVVVLIMISCSACGNSQKESNGIRYESGTFHDKNWSETIGTKPLERIAGGR